MRLIDITHPLGESTAVWPGDPPFSLTCRASLDQGDPVNVSRISMSAHVGTHADAPWHYDRHGAPMAEVPLEPFIGPAVLVALEGRASISPADLRAAGIPHGTERVLIRTGSCPDLTRFHPDLTYLEPEAIRYLASMGVRLVGTDAHSVDRSDSEDLPVHRACAAAGVLILENLNLAGVAPGEYELIALPLKLERGDGSPVRAVLRTLR